MYPAQDGLPAPLSLDSLDALTADGDINETPFNVFIGHNLGHRVFTMSVPFRQFYDISDVANDRDAGPVAQRPLDLEHARNLAKYMLRGLISAAKMRRMVLGKEVPPAFDAIMSMLGNQPYFSLQPIVCNIRSTPYGGNGLGGIRGVRLQTEKGETAAFKVFLSERHVLWVIDGQHRRAGAEMVMAFLQTVRQTGRYPGKAPVIYPEKSRDVSPDEMVVWNEAYDAARSYATLTIEVHLGLDIEQERQLFHDLNKLGKKVSSSMALQFDSSNPITQFIKTDLVADGVLRVTDVEAKDWAADTGEMVLKDVVAITSLAFLNKSNASGATPAIVDPRRDLVLRLWQKICEIPGFGESRAKEKTVAAQPVVLKALAKLAFDFNFNNRRSEDGPEIFEDMLRRLDEIDFSHGNPMWRFFDLSNEEIEAGGLAPLRDWLPAYDTGVNRDVGAFQGGYMRFGAKHNDIYPVIGDMIRWKLNLPNRHAE